MQQGKAPAQVPQPATGDRLSPLFGGGCELAAEQRFAELDGERFDQVGDPVESGTRLTAASRRGSSGGRSRSAARGRRAPGGAWRSITWPPANGSLSPASKPERGAIVHRFPADPRVGGPAAAVAEHDRRNACGRRRHRMAVEQQRAAEAVEQQRRAGPRSRRDRDGAPGRAARRVAWGDRRAATDSRAAASAPARFRARRARAPLTRPRRGAVDHRRDRLRPRRGCNRRRRAASARSPRRSRAEARATPAGRPADLRAPSAPACPPPPGSISQSG